MISSKDQAIFCPYLLVPLAKTIFSQNLSSTMDEDAQSSTEYSSSSLLAWLPCFPIVEGGMWEESRQLLLQNPGSRCIE